MIEKIQKNKDNFRYKEYFYGSAREAMYDYVNHAVSLGYRHIILPAYIGWSS